MMYKIWVRFNFLINISDGFKHKYTTLNNIGLSAARYGEADKEPTIDNN